MLIVLDFPMACRISSFGEIALAMSKADIERPAEFCGTACSTVPSRFFDDLNLLIQKLFLGLLGDSALLGAADMFVMASYIEDVFDLGVIVPRRENMDTLLLAVHCSSA